MASIAPSERLRRELQEIVAGVGEEDDPIEASTTTEEVIAA